MAQIITSKGVPFPDVWVKEAGIVEKYRPAGRFGSVWNMCLRFPAQNEWESDEYRWFVVPGTKFAEVMQNFPPRTLVRMYHINGEVMAVEN